MPHGSHTWSHWAFFEQEPEEYSLATGGNTTPVSRHVRQKVKQIHTLRSRNRPDFFTSAPAAISISHPPNYQRSYLTPIVQRCSLQQLWQASQHQWWWQAKPRPVEQYGEEWANLVLARLWIWRAQTLCIIWAMSRNQKHFSHKTAAVVCFCGPDMQQVEWWRHTSCTTKTWAILSISFSLVVPVTIAVLSKLDSLPRPRFLQRTRFVHSQKLIVP